MTKIMGAGYPHTPLRDSGCNAILWGGGGEGYAVCQLQTCPTGNAVSGDATVSLGMFGNG
jgi:hypothetical protein